MQLRCGHEASIWRKEPPESAHAYRVECDKCGGRFEKWGTEAELSALRAAGADVKVVPYQEPDAGPNLDDFLSWD